MHKPFALMLLVASCLAAYAQPKKITPSPAAKPSGDSPSIGALTAGLGKSDGFLPFYWDEKKGRLYLEIRRFDTELLYYPSLAAGVGSNDIGLDRGRLGQEHVVKFVRSGPKVLLSNPTSPTGP
jgi:hypothetical protein